MMSEMFADWYVKADREPSAQRLKDRAAGVDSYLSSVGREALTDLLRFLGGRVEDLKAPLELQQRLKEADEAFLLRGNDQELRVLASIALILAMEGGSKSSTAVALAVDVASQLGTEELGPLGADLIETAQGFLTKKARSLRGEPTAPDFTRFKKPQLDSGAVELPKPGSDVPQLQENLQKLTEYATTLNSSIKRLGAPLNALAATQDALVAAVAFNSVLAEESSMVWWLVGGHSRDLDVALDSLTKESVCVVVGKDVASLTRFRPGPVCARAIMHKALDTAGIDPEQELELAQVVEATDRELAAGWLRGLELERVRGLGTYLPALAARHELGDEGDWRALAQSRDGVGSPITLTQLEWARLCFGEWLLLNELREAE